MSKAGSWKSLLQTISSFRGDLSTLTAPPFILSPVSQLEYEHYWYTTENVLNAAAYEKDPLERFLLILKWLFTVMHSQFTQRNQKEGYEKKPLNPFLGELFVASLEDGKAELVAEQVSHHPPVSAFHISNDEVNMEGFVGVRARFTSTICVTQSGHTVLTLKKLDETYVISLPSLHIEGFLMGSPFIECSGQSTIISSSGYKATLSYSGAGYIRGQKHSVRAVICELSAPETALYVVKGQWHRKLTIRNEATGEESPFVDVSEAEPADLTVRPFEEQHPLESRRAWKAVADAVRSGSSEEISKYKSELENSQRSLRAYELENETQWQRRWWDFVENPERDAQDDPYVVAMDHLNQEAQPFWRFNIEKYRGDEDFRQGGRLTNERRGL